MIVCFNCERKTKEFLDSLISDGKYKDYAEVLSAAVSNLAVLEAEIGDHEAVFILPDLPHDEAIKVQRSKSIKEPRSHFKRQDRRNKLVIPPIFASIGGAKNTRRIVAKLPTDVWGPNQEVPLDRWLFGQYNKLLPVKVSVRALANLIRRSTDAVDLNEVSTIIAAEATLLGDFLVDLDRKSGAGRDALLATAFPNSGDKLEKSQLRFANQFVGNLSKEGQLTGLLSALKFINRIDGSRTKVSLTKPGWRFALMANPLLDESLTTPNEKFAKDEIDFLIEHIKECVPAERYAYSSIISCIKQGKNTPDTIDSELQRKVSLSSGRSLSSSFLSSQRSGAISRMADIGMVSRERDGVRVLYSVTDLGKLFEAQFENQKAQ